jgi:beta-lysine 5,6-aminomutase alpha subunit
MSDRALSIENAKYIFNNMRNIGDEVEFKEGGIIQTRAAEVLQKAADMLADIEEEGLFATIEQGKFGGVKRSRTGGKGLDGVVVKDYKYMNPFIPLMLNR